VPVQNGGGSVSKDSGAGSKDKNERGPGLTDQEKLILQKAKMIEAKNRFKAKWPEPPRRKVSYLYAHTLVEHHRAKLRVVLSDIMFLSLDGPLRRDSLYLRVCAA
jgi:hypothetical protein